MTDGKKSVSETLYQKWNELLDKILGEYTPKARLLMLAYQFSAAFVAFIYSVYSPNIVGYGGRILADAFFFASGRYSAGVFVGAMYGAYYSQIGASYLISLSAVASVRLAVWKFIRLCDKEKILTKISFRAGYVLLLSLMNIISVGFDHTDTGAMAAGMALTAVSCIAMLFYLCGFPKKGVASVVYYLSMLFVFSSLVFSARSFTYVGGNIGIVLAVMLALFVSNAGGAIWGAAVGAFLGAFCSLEFAIPTAVIGFCYGIVASLGYIGSVGVSVVAGAIISVMFYGMPPILDFIPESIIAAAVATPSLRYSLLPNDFPFKRKEAIFDSDFKNTEHISREARLSQLLEQLEDISLSDSAELPASAAFSVIKSILADMAKEASFGELLFKSEYSSSGKIKYGESVGGDKLKVFEYNGVFYAVLTDGMGSGEEASVCSEFAVRAIEGMLRCGLSAKTALSVADILLRMGFDECFVAADILTVDLSSGTADFSKCGASASYIVRKGKIHSIKARSLPIGISSYVEPETVTLDLLDGDAIVMVSDGICPDGGLAQDVLDVLLLSELKNAENITSDVMKIFEKNNRVCDDMTIFALKIHKIL